MPIPDKDKTDDALAALHPDYSELDLIEAHARLRQYFDLAWDVFKRLEREGKLDELNLTAPRVNPTVKPPKSPRP